MRQAALSRKSWDCPAMLLQDRHVIAAEISLDNAQNSQSDRKLRRDCVEKRTELRSFIGPLPLPFSVLLPAVFLGTLDVSRKTYMQGKTYQKIKLLGDGTGMVYMHPAQSGVEISTTDQALDRRRLLP